MRILIRFVLIGLLALMLTGCTDKKGQISGQSINGLLCGEYMGIH